MTSRGHRALHHYVGLNFYAHYTGTRDVLAQIEDDMVYGLLQLVDEIDVERLRDDPLAFAEQMSAFISSDRAVYARLVGPTVSALFIEKLRLVWRTPRPST